LQYRSKNKSQYANCFHTSVAGHVSFGDSAKETVIKEAEEEIGLKMDKLKLTHMFDIEEALVVPETEEVDNKYRTVWGYVFEDENINILKSEEVESLKWLDIAKFEDGIKDGTWYSKMLQHDKSYYLKVIKHLNQLLEKNAQ